VARKDYSSAYENYKLYTIAKDSIQSDENATKAVRTEMNYEFAKKQALTKLDEEKREAVHLEEAKKQRVVIYFGAGILLLVLGFALFAYRSYLQKQKANVELDDKNRKIENAYKIIEHKNTEITDSINYAKKIQQSILPEPRDFSAAFPESFVFYRPKDIVGGDFYSLNKIAGKNYLAIADCTGHGVPGAFMSLVGSRELSLAIDKSASVSEILAHLNRGMKETLKQNQQDKTKDGMDVALVKFEDNGIVVSSANRPLWIFRKMKNEIEEVRPTKAAIGGFTPDEQIFEQHEIVLERGDVVYIFSDGYADQFGGEKGKKMTSKKFREVLLNNSGAEMVMQGTILEKHFDEWRGNTEQIDDVLVIGIKI
jgi:serine phosphatase RsbU (regulator of sigma subunit)